MPQGMINTPSRSIEGMVAAVMLLVATVRDGMAPAPEEPAEPAWEAPLRAMAEALSHGDQGRARRAHQDAHAAVLAARSWDGMLAVGGAALRLPPEAGDPGSARGAARRMYLWALVRARGIGSLAGVLRAGEAFAALGDRDMTALSLRVAEALRPDAADPLADRLREEVARLDRAAARRMAFGDDAAEGRSPLDTAAGANGRHAAQGGTDR